MMGTRCGALDPGVLLYLMRQHRMDAASIEDLIYRRSGLLGVSNIRPICARFACRQNRPRARAIALFVYRIVREMGSLTAGLGRLDGIVFSGGIGENDAAPARRSSKAGMGRRNFRRGEERERQGSD